MIKAIICGANGAMGQTIAGCINESSDMGVIAGVDKFPEAKKNEFPVFANIFDCPAGADVIIDFSRPDAFHANASYAERNGVPMVIGTTGFKAQELSGIRLLAKSVPVFMSANMSLGINLQMDLIKRAAAFLGRSFDVEIIERHHNKKVDAPSGTANMLADAVCEAVSEQMERVCDRQSRSMPRSKSEIGILSVRGGTVVGEHEVCFMGQDEILEIKHSALSKKIFAMGAVKAARFIAGQNRVPGLYDMHSIISEKNAVTNVYADESQAVITLAGLPDAPEALAGIFEALAKSNVNIDMITQNVPESGSVSVSFSLPLPQLTRAIKTIDAFDYRPKVDTGVTKITVEGLGMQHQPGVAGNVFSALAGSGIKLKLITTSETKISMLVDKADASTAVAALGEYF